MKKYPVVAQEWTESERGWGRRPDGFSLHLTNEACAEFIRRYNAKYNNEKETPECYSFADGSPRVIDVGIKTYKKINAGDFGVFVPNLQNLD